MVLLIKAPKTQIFKKDIFGSFELF